jgi:hypothetical protein
MFEYAVMMLSCRPVEQCAVRCGIFNSNRRNHFDNLSDSSDEQILQTYIESNSSHTANPTTTKLFSEMLQGICEITKEIT